MVRAWTLVLGVSQSVARDEGLVALGHHLQREGYRFVTITPFSHRLVNARPRRSTVLNAVFGWNRWVPTDELDRHLLGLMEAAHVLEVRQGLARSLVRFSTIFNQIYIHSPFPTERKDSVFFGPDTYRFCRAIRHDIQRHAKDELTIVDVGCGCGAGGIYAAGIVGERRAHLTLSDINPEAIRYSAVNAQLNDTPNVRLAVGDGFERIDGKFDYIVSNPPFMVDAEKRLYRDGGGQFGVELSLRILHESLSRLNSDGRLLLYTASPVIDGEHIFLKLATPILERGGLHYEYEEVDPDIFGEELECSAYQAVDRLAAVTLTVSLESHHEI